MSKFTDQQWEAHLWLSRMWGRDNEIASYERRKENIISQLSGIGKYDADFIPTNTGENSVETKNLEYSMLCDKLDKLLDEISTENVKTMQIIDKIKDPTSHNMLFDRYLNRMSWNQIQNKYHYAQRQPYRIINDGLAKVRTFIPDEWVAQLIQESDILQG